MRHTTTTPSSTRVDVLRWLNATIATDSYVEKRAKPTPAVQTDILGLIVTNSSVWLDGPPPDGPRSEIHVERPAAVELRIRAAIPWKVLVRTESAILDPSEDKPVSDVRLRAAGAPDYIPLSTSERIMLRGEKAEDWITRSFDLDLVGRPGEGPGPYHVQLLFAIRPDTPAEAKSA